MTPFRAAALAFAAVALLLPTMALAAEWSRYDNARFGYGTDVPPGFVGGGEADNGDGQAFTSADGRSALQVWGGFVLAESFEAEVATARGYATADGIDITYEAVTPSWASFSGKGNGRILYQRMIALCGGDSYAAFALTYPVTARDRMDPVVERLVASLKPAADAC